MSQAEGESTNGRPIAFVMLERAEFPDVARLMGAVQSRIPGFTDLYPGDAKQERGLIGQVDGSPYVVAFYDKPNPLAANDSCIRSAWWWPTAWECLKERKAHVVVCMIGSDEPRRCYKIIAKLAAAVIETSPAIGILLETADAVWPADEFRVEVDQSGEKLPVKMFVSVKLAHDLEYSRVDGGWTYFGLTWGLAALDLMEIEVRGFDGTPDELVAMMLNMASYLINRGASIKHGETVGYDDEQKFTVRHEPSTIAPGQTVHRLYLTSIAR